MKALTVTQKKWALTASLATAMTFNLILSTSSQGLNASVGRFPAGEVNIVKANSASTPKKFLYSDDTGDYIATFVGTSDDKSMNQYKLKAEGGICEQQAHCGDTAEIPKEITVINDMVSQIQKAYGGAPTVDDNAGADQDVEDQDQPAQAEAPHQKDKLDLLNEACAKGDLKCFFEGNGKVDGLNRILREKKGIYDQDRVMDLYSKRVEIPLIMALIDKSPSKTEAARKMLKTFMAVASDQYSYLRERMALVAAHSIAKKEAIAQEKFVEAKKVLAAGDKTKANEIYQNAKALRNDAKKSYADLNGDIKTGLELAQASKVWDDSQSANTYYTMYTSPASKIVDGMDADPFTYEIPNLLTSSSPTVQTAPVKDALEDVLQPQKPVGAQRIQTANGDVQFIPRDLNQNVSPTGRPMIMSPNGGPNTAEIRKINVSDIPQH